MDEKKNLNDYCTRFVVAVFLIFFIYIMICAITKNLIYDAFGIVNPFVEYFAGVEEEDKDSEGAEKVEIDWKEQYAFDDGGTVTSGEVSSLSERYIEKVEKIEKKILYYPDETVPFKEEMAFLARNIESLMGYDLQPSADKDKIICMQNGYLTYPQPKVSEDDIREIADSLADFRSCLAEDGIPFIYANTGSKVCPIDRQLQVENVENTNENADMLLSMLKDRGVDVLDFRTEMINAGLDWYASYYKTDHHWTTQTGLWAAGIMAKKLNDDYGYSFDLKRFDSSEYQMTTYDNFWIGAQGRKDAFANSSLESFSLLLPKYETDFSISIPTRAIDLSGEYSDTLVDTKVLDDIKEYSRKDFLKKVDAYHCSQIRNDALTEIENHLQTNNQEKKILFIQDSFSWYSTSFLAGDVSKIDIIYPMGFDGSIRAYIRENKPDIVVMMYCARKIDKIKWDTHLSPYDLR